MLVDMLADGPMIPGQNSSTGLSRFYELGGIFNLRSSQYDPMGTGTFFRVSAQQLVATRLIDCVGIAMAS
jgi:hypothetical protein